MPIKECTLYCRENGSDKVYQASIEGYNGGYLVNFAYGPRGGTLRPGTKTPSPVTLAVAEKTYDKIVKEKLGKGYVPGEDGKKLDTSAMDFLASREERFTGILPQLLNAVEEDRLELLFKDNRFMAQEKHDGERRGLVIEKDRVYGTNRKGEAVPLPEGIAREARLLQPYAPMVLDGEEVGDVFHAFDIRKLEGEDIDFKTAEDRYFILRGILAVLGDVHEGAVRVVGCAFTEEQKRKLFADLKARRAEGIVFKDREASYTPGRPNSGGPQLKFKFTESATVLVVGANGTKRSVKIGVIDSSKVRELDSPKIKDCGSVTIPPNYEIPKSGYLVEVEYLYVGAKGSLYQPVYKGKRTDKMLPDSWASLKQKPTNNDDDTDN